jgi:hypothetical protein
MLHVLNILRHIFSDNEKKIKQGWGEAGAAEFQG